MNPTESDASGELVALLKRFLNRDIDASTFVASYQKAWRKWRDTPELYALNRASADAFDRAFTAADCYTPGNRTEWDIGSSELYTEISNILNDIDRS
jgi:hypothetical protein